jgi:predicted nucleotidyltransferase
MIASESNEYYQRLDNFSRVNRLSAIFYNANPKLKPMSPIDLNDEEILSFLRALEARKVRYMLVGGFAVAFHGFIRATMDLDLWIEDEPGNIERFKQVLTASGVVGLDSVRSFDLVPGFTQFAIGKSGFLIDPMKTLRSFSSFDFSPCYERAIQGEFNGVTFKVISREDLLKEKIATNRSKDISDIEFLKSME